MFVNSRRSRKPYPERRQLTEIGPFQLEISPRGMGFDDDYPTSVSSNSIFASRIAPLSRCGELQPFVEQQYNAPLDALCRDLERHFDP